MARPTPEINAGSMADIAFLLLVFFLVTTTMDVDSGIRRMLPPPLEEEQEKPETKINQRNVLNVLVSSQDALLVKDDFLDISQLRAKAKDFFAHHPGDETYPKLKDTSFVGFGNVQISEGVISLKNDRGTSYKMYIHVQNELAAAVRELRDEESKRRFGMPFEELQKKDKNKDKTENRSKIIEKIYPMRISEAEPEDIGGN